MKPEHKKRLKELAKNHPTYSTQDEALLALCKKTQWNAGIYLSIFPTGDGKYYFTTNEEEALDTASELREKEISFLRVVNDGSDEKLEKKMDGFYRDEMRVEFDKYVPPTHPEYKALWKACSSELGMFADGLGGLYGPENAVEDTMTWFRDSKQLWDNVITECYNLEDNEDLTSEEAEKQIKEWTKGKTVLECAGLSMEEWMECKIYSEEDFVEFAKHLVYRKTMVGCKFTGKLKNWRTAKIVWVK